MKKVTIVLSLIVLASCSGKFMPTQTDADRGAAKYPGLTVAELTEARALFRHKCTQCHPAKKPTSRDEAAWRSVVPKMAEKAKRKGKEEITPEDQQKILKYLITMSNR